MPEMIGAQLGQYVIEAELFDGFALEGYLARDTMLERTVMLIPVREEIAAEPADWERLRENTARAASLGHSDLLQIYSLESDGGLSFWTCEPPYGRQLTKVLSETPLGEQRTKRVAASILLTLDALHERDLTHGWLTSDHVFVSDDRTQILYLGGDPGLPSEMRELGADPRTDVLAFGQLVEQMVLGPRRAVFGDELPELLFHGPLREILRRSTAAPDSRYASAGAVLADWRDFGLEGLPEIQTRGVVAVPAIGGVLAAIGAVGGLGGLAGLLLWFRGGEAPPPPTAGVTDQPPPVVEVGPDPATLAEIGRMRGELLPLRFSEESAELDAESRDSLERLARLLRENPEVRVLIEGHVNPNGLAEFNRALGDRRAQGVRDHLVSLGVSSEQLRTISLGENLPMCQEATDECRARNDRVEFGLAGERRYSWNHWVETLSGGLPPSSLIKGTYSVVFDLSALDYELLLGELGTVDAERVKTDGVAPRLEAVIAEGIEALTQPGAEKYATIWVQPVLAGDGLRFAQGSETAQKVTIELAKLSRPPPLSKKPEWVRDVAREASALRQRETGVWQPIRIDVETAHAVGCPAVALSIWNESVDRPLDAIAHVVPLNGADCTDLERIEDTLDDRLLGLYGAASRVDLADAALHLFELDLGSSKPRSLAVFHDGTEFLTWELAGPFSEFVSDDLAAAVGKARQAARYDFTAVSDRIKAELFTAWESPAPLDADEADTQPSQVDRARKALRDLAAKKRPRLFAKLVDRAGKSLFLPLGLLEFGDQQPLAKRAEIIQPFFKEDFAEKDCISSWTTVIPRLGEIESSPADRYWTVPDNLPGRIEDWGRFGSYLRPDRADQPRSPEGLILLAHHDKGSVWWLDKEKESYRTVGRAFKHGSVVVFASCSAGALDDLGFAGRLEESHVDAAILAPVPVKIELALRFAVNFAEQARLAEGKEVTLEQLFSNTIAALEEDPEVLDPEAVYEFLIAGNGKLTTCGAEDPGVSPD